MKTISYLSWAGSILAVLALSPSAAAQSNSYANMLNMTQTWNKSLWDAQRGLEQVIKNGEKIASRSEAPSTSSSVPVQPAPAPAPVPLLPRYPITATDFLSLPQRVLVEQSLSWMIGATPQQKQAMRILYERLFLAYESKYRKGNVATAVAYAVGVSLEIQWEREIPDAQCDSMIQFVNDALANNPRFYAMTPQQKQMLYESMVFTGGMVGTLYFEGKQSNDLAMQGKAKELSQFVLRTWAGM